MSTAILRSRILDLAIKGELTHSNTEEWENVKLGDVCSFQNGYAFDSHDYCTEGVPLIRIGDIKDGKITFEKCTYICKNVGDNFCIHQGDLLIAMSGASTGKIGIYDDNRVAYLNQRVGNIKVVDNSKIIPQYRNLFLQSQSDTIYKLAYGGAQPNISGKMILNLSIPLPPLSEQHRIVAKVEELLSEVDKIEQAQTDITHAATILRSRILDSALKGELTHSNTEEWENVKLGDVAEIVTGSTPSKDDLSNYGSEYPFYKPGDLIGKYISNSVDGLSSKGYDLSRKLPKNSILVCCIGSLGKCSIITNDGSCNQQINAILPSKKYITEYLFYVIQSAPFIKSMWDKATSTTVTLLNKNKFSEIEVPLPPLAEQRRIVAKIEQLFAEIDKLVK